MNEIFRRKDSNRVMKLKNWNQFIKFFGLFYFKF